MATETKPVEAKKRPINRLRTVYALRNMLDEQYTSAQEGAKEGKPVAWCMAEAFASNFLNAMDVESIYTENYATRCGATGIAWQPGGYIDRSGAEGFPPTLCNYATNCFGYTSRMVHELNGEIPPEAPSGGMPKPALLVGSCGGSCDARYKWYQAMGRYLDTPVWIMEVGGMGQGSAGREALDPAYYENEVQFITAHLRDFVVFLEQLFKKKFNYDKFEKSLDDTIEMNRTWYGITDELRKARPCPMNARDHYSAMNMSLFRANDPKAANELFTNMREEVLYRIENKIAGINYPEKYRASFQGLGPWHGLSLFDRLAERSWNFPREGYHPPDPIDVSWVKDPIERLVRYRRRSLPWQIENSFPDPNEAEEVREEFRKTGASDKLAVVDARDYQIDGVILHTALTCRMTSCRTGMTQQQLMKVYKVPSLLVFGDMVDSRVFNLEDFLRRAEAFEETMDHFKEERKKIGLAW